MRAYHQITFVSLIYGVVAYAAVAAENQVSVTTDSVYRYITANGIPDHGTGHFPNRGNPNTISAQSYHYRVPLQPKLYKTSRNIGMSAFGVAVNGVPFDPSANEFWNNDRTSGWQYDALSGAINLGMDANNAHVQPGGAYHYHGIPTGLVGKLDASTHAPLVGWAADGFPIYVVYGYKDPADMTGVIVEQTSSWRLKEGTRPDGPGGRYDGTFVQDYVYTEGAGTLDECNGIYTRTPDYPGGTYAYFLTRAFPVVPRCLMGQMDDSFRKHPPQGGRGMPGGHGHPHPPFGGPPPYGPR
ncbi:MAG: YHYH protein [Proteobacteria bacterium]|nr:YHYH protein [Pseudomonadota bacterium]